MKAIVLALTLLASGSAFAGEFTSFGRIFFQSASTWVPANRVCQMNGLYYHTQKAAVAVRYCDGEGNGNCKTVLKPLVQPIASTKTVCARSNGGENEVCQATKLVDFTQGPVVKVEFYSTQHAMDQGNASRVGSYTIPACASTPVTPAN